MPGFCVSEASLGICCGTDMLTSESHMIGAITSVSQSAWYGQCFIASSCLKIQCCCAALSTIEPKEFLSIGQLENCTACESPVSRSFL